MKLKDIINVSGIPGLHKVISQSKKNLIIESIVNKKRIPLGIQHQANSLDEIGIYTYEDTIPISEVFKKIAEDTDYKETINHKSPEAEIKNYFRKIVENYDEERVYVSNIRKVIQWYNLLQSTGLIKKSIKKKNTKSLKTKKS